MAAAEKLRELRQKERDEVDLQNKALETRLKDLQAANDRLGRLASESDVSVSHALKRLSEPEVAEWVREFDPASFDFDYSDLTLKQMRELLNVLGPESAAHIIAQGDPREGCRLLLSLDDQTFEELINALSPENLAAFFLVRDKHIFDLLDHR